MHSKTKSWAATHLWQLLEDRKHEADSARQLLTNIMPEIETVLAKGGTSPIDFTLHDEEHAFRVAQRMFELLPEDVASKLTPFELALLLLSAYLHDIGMTPTRDVVKKHYEYILTTGDGLLSEIEVKELQHWLDEAHGGLELPMSKGLTTVEGLEKAEELLAYYCRHRHNDWSETWIRKHLTDAKHALYPGWVDDLVNLCRSHHEGLEALRQDRFQARYRGNPPQVVNLRYLAALLRVADVMEFDPERTPDVIIAHREIAPKSRIFWHKDRFSFLIDQDKREFRLDAITPDAKVHRAGLETVQQVDQELLTSNALETSGAFVLGSFKDDRCHWPWPARVNAKITEREGRFVYIEGAFRPEPQHILKLLGGVELYKDPMVAVRELLQNALDSVKEHIACERLRLISPGDAAWEQKLGEQHKVTLSLIEGSDGFWLVCDDDGVGMTRAIIERHLLVSGAPPLPEVHQLEREANASGFSVERSAQFGIGVLSYFMIADRMVITTRRSVLAGGDPDGTGWRFETEGLAGFGQLTPVGRSAQGAEVRLRIRPEVIADIQADLFKYIQGSLAHAPCRVEVMSSGRCVGALGPGWCQTVEELASRLLAGVGGRNPHSLRSDSLEPLSAIRRREEQSARWDEVRHKAMERLRWRDPVAGWLRDGLGRFRMHFPYFDLHGGPCLAFLDVEGNRGRFLNLPAEDDEDVHGFLLQGRISHSWRGFRMHPGRGFPVHRRPPSQRLNVPVVVEVDWRHGASIGVDRGAVELSDDASKSLRHLYELAGRQVVQAANAQLGSLYHQVDRCIALSSPAKGEFVKIPTILFYPRRETLEEFAWEQVAFPAIRVGRRAGRSPIPSLIWKNRLTCQISSMYLRPTDRRLWLLRGFAPDRIVTYARWMEGPLDPFPYGKRNRRSWRQMPVSYPTARTFRLSGLILPPCRLMSGNTGIRSIH